MAMGQKPVPPVNVPIPTKIDYNGWCTYPKMVPLVLKQSHILQSPTPEFKAGNLHGRASVTPELAMIDTNTQPPSRTQCYGSHVGGNCVFYSMRPNRRWQWIQVAKHKATAGKGRDVGRLLGMRSPQDVPKRGATNVVPRTCSLETTILSSFHP